jgi:hypothetical protein
VLAPTARVSAAPSVPHGSLENGREIFDPTGPFIPKDELVYCLPGEDVYLFWLITGEFWSVTPGGF